MVNLHPLPQDTLLDQDCLLPQLAQNQVGLLRVQPEHRRCHPGLFHTVTGVALDTNLNLEGLVVNDEHLDVLACAHLLSKPLQEAAGNVVQPLLGDAVVNLSVPNPDEGLARANYYVNVVVPEGGQLVPFNDAGHLLLWIGPPVLHFAHFIPLMKLILSPN